jgi:hypothetical protein
VRLSGEEREQLEALIRKGKSPAQRLLKARILLKADVSDAGEGWSDSRVIKALETSASMVFRVRNDGKGMRTEAHRFLEIFPAGGNRRAATPVSDTVNSCLKCPTTVRINQTSKIEVVFLWPSLLVAGCLYEQNQAVNTFRLAIFTTVATNRRCLNFPLPIPICSGHNWCMGIGGRHANTYIYLSCHRASHQLWHYHDVSEHSAHSR